MKKHLLYFSISVILLAGCRQKGDIYLDPSDPINMSYTTYAGQFDIIWRGMNSYYVFWSEDSTDWNNVYTTMYPKFEALDEAYRIDSIAPDSATLMDLYAEATSTLIDHHLGLQFRDVHTGKNFVYTPGEAEVKRRDYAIGQKYGVAAMTEAISSTINAGLLDRGQWGEMDGNRNFFGTRTLEDGRKVAYLWQNNFNMQESLQKEGSTDAEKNYISNIRNWLDMCLNEPRLAGIILDNRCNKGGQTRDLDLVIGAFLNEPLHYADLRYKEGPGRYDYTEWIPAYVDTTLISNRRDLEAEHIPYIVLTNAYSVSMAETSAVIIKHLPTGRMIGERTFGAHGQLMSYSTIFHDGTFGTSGGKHYVYMSSMQTRFTTEGVLEGIGITPTKTILQEDEGYLGAMTKAIDYIKAY